MRNTLDFDNWVGMQQGYWYQRIEQVFDWLSQLQKAEGMLEQADKALQSLLLRESSHRQEGSRGVSYVFAHDKIREVVNAVAGDARRRVFSDRASGPGAREHSRRRSVLPHARQRTGSSYVSVI